MKPYYRIKLFLRRLKDYRGNKNEYKKKIIASTMALTLIGSIGVDSLLNINDKDSVLSTAQAAFKNFKGKVTTTTLNVRKFPNSKAKLVGKLKKGKEVTVSGKDGDWYKIKYSKDTKGYAWVSSKYIKKNATDTALTKNIPNAPKKSKGYYLPTESYVLPVDMVQGNKITITNTWHGSTKSKEIKELAEELNLIYSGDKMYNFIEFTQPNKKHPGYLFDDVTVYQEFYSSKKMGFGLDNHRGIRKSENEYLLKLMLRPYFPKSYKSLAEKFVKKGYADGGKHMDKEENIEGFKVQMAGGVLYVSK